MLSLLKKYQKSLFIFIALLVGFSVMFVGILPRQMGALKDPVAFKTVTGEKVKRSRYEKLKSMIATNNGEMLLYGGYLGLHFFPEDVLTENLVQSGLIALIAEKKAKELEPFWKEQQTKEANFKPYTHPESQMISAQNIWKKHSPKIIELMDKLKTETDPLKAFEIRNELFLHENDFSPYALWQFLSQQQKQYQWLAPDENMTPLSLSLFGYRSLQDWYGELMIDYVAQFVLNTASYAKKKGYRATYQEAENSLMAANRQALKQIQFLGLKDFNDPESYFQAKLLRLGMNKMEMITLWQDVLTMQNLMNEAAQAALLDDLTLENFETFATEKVDLLRFAPAAHLQFKSAEQLAQFENYLQALGKPTSELGLDFALKPLAEIEQESPQLVQQMVEIEYKEVDLQKAALTVSVQDIWKYKSDPKNTHTLKAKFPKIDLDETLDPQAFQAQLEKIDGFTEMQIDGYIRELLLKQQSNWLELAFEKQSPVTDEVMVRKSGYRLPFKGIETAKDKEIFLTRLFNEDIDKLSKKPISFDDKHYYQILTVKLKDEPKLVDYQELVQDKTAQKMLHKKLAAQHKNGADSQKDFSKVQAQLIQEFLKPIQGAILEDYVGHLGHKPPHLTDSFYCQYRLFSVMRQALEDKKLSKETELVAFKMNVNTENLVRSESNTQELDELLKLNEQHFTDVSIKGYGPEFIQLVTKGNDMQEHPMQKAIRQKLAKEAIRALGKELLEMIDLLNLDQYSS